MDKFTDQYFTYRETPVDYDGVGNITRIKGNTLVWNQLAKELNATNWLAESATASYSDGICTLTPSGYNARISADADIIANHKYLMIGDFTNADNQPVYFYIGAIGSYSTGIRIPQTSVLTRQSKIYTATETGKIYVRNNSNTGVVTIKNLMLIDLTQMGLDSLTVEEFTSLFPLPYYGYNQGTLLSFNGNGIKTTGKNKFQNGASTVTKNGITFTINADKSITVDGTATANASLTASADNLIAPHIEQGESLIFSGSLASLETTNDGYFQLVYKGDSTGQTYSFVSTGGNEVPISATEDMTLDGVYFSVRAGKTVTNETAYPMLRNADTDSTYEPYTESTTSLPTLTYFPNGMKSAGSVRDELTDSKATTRVGQVDLGTLTWTLGGSGIFYDTPVINDLIANSINIKSSRYTTGYSSDFENDSSLIGFSISANKKIRFYNSGLSSASAVASALSGVYLNYELSAESEQDINIRMIYPIYADGTEQILPTSDTSPFFGDIEYYNGTEGETNIRKFWLINGENERWDLTEKEFKAFLNNPQGLGFRKTVESVRYGERQNKVSETYNFPQPQGELLFYDSYNSTRYDKYNKFIRFLMNQPITLYYMIPVSYISGIANIYTLDCEVTEVQKTESKTDNILRSSIVFNGMEFYKGDPITVNGTGTSYTLTNEGDFPVGFEITIEGNLTNPYVTLSQDGELYGEAKFDSETAFNSVYVNSNDGEQNVILEQDGAVIPNPLSYQDLSISNGSIYVTFVKLARGDSELSIGMESGSITSVSIKYTPQYRSV